MKKVIAMIDKNSITTGVSLIDFKKAEKQLGAFFPDEFKDLYLETNGAEFGEWRQKNENRHFITESKKLEYGSKPL